MMDLLREFIQWLGLTRLELGFWSFPILLGLIFLRRYHRDLLNN